MIISLKSLANKGDFSEIIIHTLCIIFYYEISIIKITILIFFEKSPISLKRDILINKVAVNDDKLGKYYDVEGFL